MVFLIPTPTSSEWEEGLSGGDLTGPLWFCSPAPLGSAAAAACRQTWEHPASCVSASPRADIILESAVSSGRAESDSPGVFI